MTLHYKRLTVADREEYLILMQAAYAPIRALGIHFDAASADLQKVTQHLEHHAVYAALSDHRLAASVTVRFPWGPLPGPFGLPHIGWFGVHPDFKGQNLGATLLGWLEQEVLLAELRAPAVSLGTAISHPWLRAMYQKLGFEAMHETDLGKGHITLYMKKVLDESLHAQWLARRTPPPLTSTEKQ
ncbi:MULTISPECIES: GNAT family N-acetyltransferase [Erwinia]|uniref:GNAT family N-acetyltransferase n=1 Tax=Erwinia TaxID=551 RepID=UPI00055203B0|nr:MULTISPECIES: GNAT family N-acetyltransferase [Erwinia]